MSGIKVNNTSGIKIDVAINHWGDDGSTGFYTIKDGDSEQWARSNNLGFVMVITQHKVDREEGTYWYVKADKEIYVRSLSEVDGALAKLPNPII